MAEATAEKHGRSIHPPLALLAEVTHRCPLACGYCSNPVELESRNSELSTEEWASVFMQAEELGVLHLHLSGGEPCSRRDIVELAEAGRRAGLYSNLITSGIGLTEKRLGELADAGIDHVQLSIQGLSEVQADHISGYRGGFKRKMEVASWIAELRLPLTLNAVVHRQNMNDVESLFDLAVELGARRLEVATVQFHGWAELNRPQFMPTRQQVEATTLAVEAARERLKGKLVIDYVPADYYAHYPKACMGGWGRVGLNVDPAGKVMPCHAASSIPWLTFENVRDRPLSDIWYDSEAFNAFRGTDWMQEPCASCERKELDFGGCRCQAMAIAGDARATDPVCTFSPLRGEIERIANEAASAEVPEGFVYRGR